MDYGSKIVVGKTFEIRGIVSWYSGATIRPDHVEAEIDGVVTPLSYAGITYKPDTAETTWSGNIDLGSASKGPKMVTIRAVGTDGKVVANNQTIIYHEKPTLHIEEPSNYAYVKSNANVKASCADDRGYVCRVTVQTVSGNYESMLYNARQSIDGTVNLSPVINRLKFTAIDSVGRTVVEYREVVPQAITSHFNTLASFSNSIVLDARPSTGRALTYNPSLKKLELRHLDNGVSTTIPLTFTETPKAFLTPVGAIIEYKASPSAGTKLMEWRDGALVDLGAINALSLKVNGGYAIFTKYVDATSGHQLFIRNLAAATNQAIDSARFVSYQQTYVAENGAVVYSLSETGNQNVMLYANGVRKKLTEDTQAANTNAITDGANVLYLKLKNSVLGNGALMLVKPDGQSVELAPLVDQYMMKNGWIAYRAVGAQGNASSTLWVVAPDGSQQRVTSLVGYFKLVDVGSQGDVVFAKAGSSTAADQFISAFDGNSRTERLFSSTGLLPLWDQSNWYGRVGDSVVRYQAGNDYTSPAWPTGGKATYDQAKSMLQWPEAQDNVGVDKYRIYVSDLYVAEVAADTRSYTIDSNTFKQMNGSGYARIRAVDLAGNESSELIAYVNKPTSSTGRPENLQAAAGMDNVTLTWKGWGASTDSYLIYQGVYLIAVIPADSTAYTYRVDHLAPNTDYTFTVTPMSDWSSPGVTINVRTESGSTPPVWPAGSQASSGGTTSVASLISWTPASDDTGVASYRIMSGTEVVAEVDGNTLQKNIEGLTPDSTYTFKIEAGDAEGNWTTTGPSVTVTTLADGGTIVDKESPAWPAGSKLTSGGTTTKIALLNWTAATDNIGVTGYRIMNGDQVIAELDGNTRWKGIEGLAPGTTYTFKVEARDAAGNWSTTGPSVTVTTLASNGTPVVSATLSTSG
ncbi:fibronectin type III domain-containing protein [Paenibacillus aurantiacus]|uniref:Fibronectin type III domain-containing protein n=1 Tax=Paenibacillus aurantiacus TaxID=1936118 RepID=A0ABV5KXR5_9BACL